MPKVSSVNFIKRVVAGPGDEIYIKEGHVYRKASGTSQFVREKDTYIRECGVSPECNFPTPIKIPAGHWFMMGDNRGESDDSRFWGPVPTGWIIGQADRHLLAPRSHRHLLTTAAPTLPWLPRDRPPAPRLARAAARAVREAAGGCLLSIAASAFVSWPAPTRPGEVASQDRSSPQPCCSTMRR